MKMNWKNSDLWIDMINMIFGIVIIILAVIAIQSSGNGQRLFAVVFLLGTLMFLLNALKFFRRSRFQAIVFLVFAIILAAACAVSIGGVIGG